MRGAAHRDLVVLVGSDQSRFVGRRESETRPNDARTERLERSLLEKAKLERVRPGGAPIAGSTTGLISLSEAAGGGSGEALGSEEEGASAEAAECCARDTQQDGRV